MAIIRLLSTFRRCCFCVFLVLVSVMSLSAGWQAPLLHFDYKDYHGGTQNWDVVFSANNWMYAANNYGLLEYDGDRWKLYVVRNNTAVRSLLYDEAELIYAGATNEFGYFEPNAFGGLRYVSLTDSLTGDYANFGEVWNIHSDAEAVYFQTDNYLIRSDKRTQDMKFIVPGAHIYCSATIRGGVYVATSDGVFALVGEQLNILNGSDKLPKTQIRKLMPWGDNQILIATFDAGLYIYDGMQVKKLNTKYDHFFISNKIYSIAATEDQLAVGTVRSGLAVINLHEDTAQYFDVHNGLNNNTVLNVVYDKDGNLVAALDNGIDVVLLPSAYSTFFSGSHALGSGYTSILLKHGYYLGTNQGLYYHSYRNSGESVNFIDHSDGQVWSLDTISGILLCSHHSGLYVVDDMHLKPLVEGDGFWRVRNYNSQYAIAGAYSGFYLLEKSGGKISVKGKIKGFRHTAMNFEIDAKGAIWTLSPEGVCRLTLNTEDMRVKQDNVYTYTHPQDYVKIFKVNDNVVITNESFCRVVGKEGVLTRDSAFFNNLDGEHFYQALQSNDNGDLWYLSGDNLSVRKCIDRQTHTYELQPRTFVLNGIQPVLGFEWLDVFNDNEAMIGAVDGFIRFDSRHFNNEELTHDDVYVRSVELTQANDSVIYGESFVKIPAVVEVNYDYNSLRFNYGSSITMSGKLYQSCLEPVDDDFSRWSTSTSREYTSLHEGKYTFRVRVLDIQTGEQHETSIRFRVLPPWHRSWWAWLIYMILVIFGLYLVYNYFEQRYINANERMEFEKNRAIHEREKQHLLEANEWERKLRELQKEKDDYELRSKSQEISNLLLNQVNRKDFADDVRKEIEGAVADLEQRHVSPALKKLRTLMAKLDSRESGEVDWKRFEENFDIVNDKFIRKLTAQYPWLSRNEKHLCVYIRMGLYTKEIAPLLNMSVRGVEMLRYRMRKKMELNRDENLEQYFRDFGD